MPGLEGKTIGKYRILESLGRGGMAEVYKAYQPGLDRYVAIKILYPFLAAEQKFVGRFQREARAVSALKHPNIVQVFDSDIAPEENVYYMVMEFVDGPTLKDHLSNLCEKGETIPLAEIVSMFKALGSAVDYAHRRGIVHRDIKPGNIMFNKEGEAVLADFGVAYLVGATQFTASGTVSGTPAYMSPEQCRGERGDGKSDMYSLGVVLYEVMTGQVPFEGDTPFAVIMKHLYAPPPADVLATVPPAIAQVIRKAMGKAPDDRYPTGLALAQALEEALAAAPETPPSSPPPETTAETLVTRLAMETTSLPAELPILPQAPTEEVEEAVETSQPVERQERIVPLAIAGVFVVCVVGLAASYFLYSVYVKLALLDTPTPTSSRLLQLALLQTSTPTASGQPVPATLLLTSPPLSAPRFSQATQTAIPLATARPSVAAAPPPIAATPTAEALSAPLPTFVAQATPLSVAASRITTATAARVRLLRELTGPSGWVESVAWSPDGKTVASGAADNTVWLWHTSDGALLRSLKGHTSAVYGVAFSPDGQTLASASADKTVRLWRVADWTALRTLPHKDSVQSLAFSPDGQVLVSGSKDGTIQLWRVQDGTLRRTVIGHEGGIWSVAVSPDGQTLASGGEDSTMRLWRAADGTLVHTLTGHTGSVYSVAFSPDGQTLASGAADSTVRLWRVSDGSLLRTLAHEGWVQSVAFSPDGQMVASGARDDNVRLWGASDGTLLRTLEEHSSDVWSVAFSPDGQTLASGSEDRAVRLWGITGD